jgi:predicted ABC-type ATPase
LRRVGYQVNIVYLWLPTADLAIARVAERVRAGGHDVPADVVRRRFTRGRRNFLAMYRPLADRWRLYDASSLRGPRLVASGGRQIRTIVHDRSTWRTASGESGDE